MKCDKKDLLLYAVTGRAWLGGRTLAEQVEEALRGGATFVQLREKELAGEALLAEAREIQALCRRYRVPFVIDDDVALARQIDADGVHVGQSDMEAQKARALLGEDKILAFRRKLWNRPCSPSKTARTTWAWARCSPPAPRRTRRM